MSNFEWRKLDAVTPFSPAPIKVAELTCFHCKRVTKVPMDTIADKETKHWREKHASLLGQLNQAIADCRMIYGTDPLSQMLIGRLIKMRDGMR